MKGLSTSIVPTSICLSRPLSSSVHRPCAAATSPSRVHCKPKKERDGKIRSAGWAATVLSNCEVHCWLPACEGSAEIMVVRPMCLRFSWFSEPVSLFPFPMPTQAMPLGIFFCVIKISQNLVSEELMCSEVTIFSWFLLPVLTADLPLAAGVRFAQGDSLGFLYSTRTLWCQGDSHEGAAPSSSHL